MKCNLQSKQMSKSARLRHERDEMTWEKVIEILSNCEHCSMFDGDRKCLANDGCFEAKQMAIYYLRKWIPKQPLRIGLCICSGCGARIEKREVNGYKTEYCYHCGQAIDWSEKE